ncbi:MAG: BrnT family toxin [Candidatus Magasanikbacteria bacterium]|nr:BrnT family toxin [Candidatus Magasanikbacteria bacterium]
MEFVWSQNKGSINYKKHGITFDEAKTAFFDENGLLLSDPDHSIDEDRFILLGKSYKLHLLVVCHCYRESDDVIRIISARKATKNERDQYKNNGGLL